MLDRRHFLFAAIASSVGSTVSAVEPRIRDTRTISVLPQTAAEMKSLHERAAGYAAELLPEDEPAEVKGFTPFLTARDEVEAKKGLLNTSCRRHALSVGLEVLDDDQRKLPTLSRDQILSYLKAHFVSVQVRIYREPVSRALYLGPRCLAATRTFRGGSLTKPFSPTVSDSVNNMRSLGLWLPRGTPSTAANLRTLVVVHKNELSQENDRGTSARTNFEYLFIRAVEAGPDTLQLHAFATSDERTTIHWLRSADSPAIPSDCSVRGAVHFTQYSHQGLYPKSAVIRRSLITGKKSFVWDDVDQYAQKEFGRPALESLSETLDAIIDGKLQGADYLPRPLSSR